MGSRISGIRRMAWAIGLTAALPMAGPSMAEAGTDTERNCYDSAVVARLMSQTPTPYAGCGDDCIVVRWPWVLELDVTEVTRGRSVPRQVAALSVQHTYFRRVREHRFLLRRNTDGGYNVVWSEDARRPPRCTRQDTLATPYVGLRHGQTLKDLIAEGRRVYGTAPD